MRSEEFLSSKNTQAVAKVLIVEDEVIQVYVLQKLLGALQHEVVEVVPNGEEAIAAVKRTAPDLIIMDVHLRGPLSGIETMHEIRQFSEVPVLFTSSVTMEEVVKKATAVSCARFLEKPLSSSMIEKALADLLAC